MSDKKISYCAECRTPLITSYFMCRDNYLQVKYFEEMDGSDNMFCSQNCACESLSIEEVEIEDGTCDYSIDETAEEVEIE